MAHYKHVLTVHPEAGKINIVSFSPTKRLLASGSSGGLVQLWDLKSRGPTKELKLRSAVLSLAWDSSSDRLFVGCKNGAILSLNPSAQVRSTFYLYQMADRSLQRGLSVIRVADRNVGHGAARTFPVDGLAINCEGQLAHTAGRHVLFYHLNGHQCLF
jgi:WD40 repeat protein